MLVMDWDAHHGHGPQDHLAAEPSASFFASYRPAPLCPGMRKLEEVGESPIVDVPLPEVARDCVILTAYEDNPDPAARRSSPS